MFNFWEEISNRLLAAKNKSADSTDTIRINNHVHTPWSYSSFNTVDDVIKQAKQEDIKVLGINDFNTVAGYGEWADKCLDNNIFPLFNIEMIGLDKANMSSGLHINDPGNPGRTYISGKALAYPSQMSETNAESLKRIIEQSNGQLEEMTQKVNMLLQNIKPGLQLDYARLLKENTRGMVRERHLAGAIRSLIHSDRVFMELLGSEYKSIDKSNFARVENLIRSRLLKAGGEAFIPEDPEIFIDPLEIRDIILDAGGIPTYPFLADHNNGSYTDFEKDREEAAIRLIEKGFYSVEFIPLRNDYKLFREYALFLNEQGFIVTFGTEHNAPGYAPLEVKAGGDVSLDEDLCKINMEGAAILASHQYLTWKEGKGYLTESGSPKVEEKQEYIELGKKLIGSVTH